jgi:hypothetical protein
MKEIINAVIIILAIQIYVGIGITLIWMHLNDGTLNNQDHDRITGNKNNI